MFEFADWELVGKVLFTAGLMYIIAMAPPVLAHFVRHSLGWDKTFSLVAAVSWPLLGVPYWLLIAIIVGGMAIFFLLRALGVI